MPGFYGTSLGKIDLAMAWTKTGWQVQNHRVTLHGPAMKHPAISDLGNQISHSAQADHDMALARMRQPVGRTAVPIQSYFATIVPDLGMQMLAHAMQDAVFQATGAEHCLAAVSPFQFGGRHGCGHFIDIPAGDLTLRDVAAIFPFADRLCAVRRTGAEIRNWLERAAGHYNRIAPATAIQPLINPHSAAYHCDAIYGLTYDIDLSQPARFDLSGAVTNPDATRITGLCYRGTAVADDATFIVAANCFRASGNGGFRPVPPHQVIWQSNDRLRDILIAALRAKGTFDAPLTPVWQFAPIKAAQAQFVSAPQAAFHLPSQVSLHGPPDPDRQTYSLHF
jgi:2',3'-cyclic-nucleotide 2'-phosphodiesterase/3'-nucleotidase